MGDREYALTVVVVIKRPTIGDYSTVPPTILKSDVPGTRF
jgi:hypothetical protein